MRAQGKIKIQSSTSRRLPNSSFSFFFSLEEERKEGKREEWEEKEREGRGEDARGRENRQIS
jgi:hypothetical protein